MPVSTPRNVKLSLLSSSVVCPGMLAVPAIMMLCFGVPEHYPSYPITLLILSIPLLFFFCRDNQRQRKLLESGEIGRGKIIDVIYDQRIKKLNISYTFRGKVYTGITPLIPGSVNYTWLYRGYGPGLEVKLYIDSAHPENFVIEGATNFYVCAK